MKTHNATLVRANGTVERIRVDPNNALAELEKLVGGYIEIVYVNWAYRRCQMIVNENGHFEHLDPNEIATRTYLGRPYYDGDPYIVGDVVMLDFNLD